MRRGRQRRQVQPGLLAARRSAAGPRRGPGGQHRVEPAPGSSPLCSRGSDLRDAIASDERCDLGGDSLPPVPQTRASVATSATFSVPNASQLRSVSSRSVSGSSEYGTCSVEHDVDTATRTGAAKQCRQRAQRGFQIGAPDVAAVDDARHQQLVRQLGHRGHRLCRRLPPGRYRWPRRVCGQARAAHRQERRSRSPRKSRAGARSRRGRRRRARQVRPRRRRCR